MGGIERPGQAESAEIGAFLAAFQTCEWAFELEKAGSVQVTPTGPFPTFES